MAACFTSGEDSVDLVLIGKTGYGKSSVGNTILNYGAFEVSHDSNSLTKAAHCAWGFIPEMNREIKIVDTPGTVDNIEQNNETLEKYMKDFPGAMSQCPKGFHALILVLQYGERYTEEDKNAVTTLRKMFGESFVKDHCIIVMTHGDKFELEYENKKEAPDFVTWCGKQAGAFQELLQECDQRIVLFYNKLKKFEKQKKAAVVKLIRLAVKLSEKGRYTDKAFEKCYLEREKLLLEHQLPRLSLEIQRKCSLLKSRVNISSLDDNINEDNLKTIKSLLFDLEKEIQTKDKGTHLLKKELEAVQDIRKAVDEMDLKKNINYLFEATIGFINFLLEIPRSEIEHIIATAISEIRLENSR